MGARTDEKQVLTSGALDYIDSRISDIHIKNSGTLGKYVVSLLLTSRQDYVTSTLKSLLWLLVNDWA